MIIIINLIKSTTRSQRALLHVSELGLPGREETISLRRNCNMFETAKQITSTDRDKVL